MNRSSSCYRYIRSSVNRSISRPTSSLLSRHTTTALTTTNTNTSSIQIQHSNFGTNSNNNNKDEPSSNASSKDGKKKENFAKKFLEPASRGELSKHQSGIPKLAARKPKGHSLKDGFPGKESEEIMMDSLRSARDRDRERDRARGGQSQSRNGQRDKGGKGDKGGASAGAGAGGSAPIKAIPDSRNLALLFQPVQPEELDPTLLNNNRKWLGQKKSMQQSLFRQQRNIKQQRGRDNGRSKYDIWGDPENQNEVDDPWVTDTLAFRYDVPHAESRREAKPINFPTNRINPPEDFVNAHQVFAYVTNVPRPVVEGELGSYENPLHRHEVTEFVADVFSVPAANVFPATMTSAFVGFKDAKEAAEAFVKSEAKRIITREKIEAKAYEISSDDDAVKEFVSASSPDCIVQLEHVPAGMRPGTIVRLLHGAITLDAKNVLCSSPTTALIRLSSSEEAASLLKNTAVQKALASMQRQILRVHSVRREVVHDKYAGPVRQIQMRKMTNKLVVDGDMPSKTFFLSHAHVMHLCNVPISLTKKDISHHFQKFCVEKRDVEGSIEIVRSADGHATGRIYVGFDTEREGEAAWKEIFASGQKMMLNEAGPAARVRPVKEVRLVRGSKLGARSERTQEELIASFTAWKDEVDPKDIEILESFGVTMDVLEEAFSAARLNNPTFGVEDQAREGERLRMEHGPGGHFSEFVQLYIETLKELAATREEPGLKYEAMFLPDEEIEFSLFDDEDKRLAALREEYKR